MWDSKTIGMSIVAVLIFALGWQTGRAMSPYYASTPIVFQSGTTGADEGGDVQSLERLRDASVATPVPKASAAPLAAPASGGASQGDFVASKNSELFHHVSCASAKSIKPANRRWFSTAEQAKSAGLTPGACTKKLFGI